MRFDKSRIANAFGANSRKVWRALIGASWSFPFRYITLGAQLTAIAMMPGVTIEIPAGWLMVMGMTAGVLVGWSLRVVDNLINEFLVFEWIKHVFVGRKKDTHGL